VILEVHYQVTGLLRHPLTRRVGRDPGQVHSAGAVLDEKQHIQAAQQHGVDMEEVGPEDRLGLGFQERPPGLPGPRGRRVDASVLEDPPDCRRRELTLEHGDLVAQDQDLRVLGPLRPGQQAQPAEHPEHREVGKS
jgi:hypothetical protein